MPVYTHMLTEEAVSCPPLSHSALFLAQDLSSKPLFSADRRGHTHNLRDESQVYTDVLLVTWVLDLTSGPHN